MTTRKTFLGRAGWAVGLLALGPEKLWAAMHRPTLTEVLSDRKPHDVWQEWEIVMCKPNPYSATCRLCIDARLKHVFIGGKSILWREKDQPAGGVMFGEVMRYGDATKFASHTFLGTLQKIRKPDGTPTGYDAIRGSYWGHWRGDHSWTSPNEILHVWKL